MAICSSRLECLPFAKYRIIQLLLFLDIVVDCHQGRVVPRLCHIQLRCGDLPLVKRRSDRALRGEQGVLILALVVNDLHWLLTELGLALEHT